MFADGKAPERDPDIIKLERELKTTQLVLGTLIVYLQIELGQVTALDLIKQLDGDL